MRARTWIAGVTTVAALFPAAPALAAPARQWQLAPPVGRAVTATVRLDSAGKLSLQVNRGTTVVLNPSALGLRTTAADLTTGLTFTGRADTRITEHYTTAAGRRLVHDADANQTTLHFAKGTNRLDLVVRVASDGVGYRYVLPRTGSVSVTGEASEFAVPSSAKAVLLPYDNGRNDYENMPVHTTVGAAAPVAYGYPSLFHVGDSWLLVAESDVNGNYGASRLTLDGTSRRFRLTLPDARETGTGPLSTPWRTMVVGDLATVTESDLVTDLASPSKVADTSWIKAGRSAWSWWSDGASPRSLDTQKQWVDFAARMGWEYILVDAGWSADWMPALVTYAHAHHVNVWIWVHFSALDTAAERDAKLPMYKSWGDGLAVLARRHGTNWFVGAVTAGAARTVSAPLAFLPAGTWLVDVYADTPGGITVHTQRVTSADTLSVPVPENGGFAAQLCPATAGATSCS